MERAGAENFMKVIWDYIVVGGGSSGAVLAARLSEDPSVTVLLIEAGADFSSADTPSEIRSANNTPMFWRDDYAKLHQWSGVVAKRSSAQAYFHYWRGKLIGGCSAINSLATIRGELEDYDLWAARGCKGWSGAEVLPYFVKLEDDRDFGDAEHHRRGGPLPIARKAEQELGSVDRALRDAALELGYPFAPDHNRPGSTGVSPFAANLRDGRRFSTNDSYLEPARARMNLTIRGDSPVDHVVFAAGTRRATGVRVTTRAGFEEIAAREIVLSAGACHSPAILLRSGIGPAAELARLGVQPVAERAGVGENLLEHATVPMLLMLAPEHRARPIDRILGMLVRFSTGLAGAGRNDIQFYSASQLMDVDQTREEGDPDYSQSPIGGILCGLYQVFSKGKLELASAEPGAEVRLDQRMLSDERDLVRMRHAMKKLFEIGRHPAVARIADAVIVAKTGKPIDAFEDDDELDAMLLEEVLDIQHAAGTCRMGSPDDALAVVDPDCRVIGVEALRVCDASIMPELPRANTHVPCVMIAEHLADRMKRES